MHWKPEIQDWFADKA